MLCTAANASVTIDSKIINLVVLFAENSFVDRWYEMPHSNSPFWTLSGLHFRNF
jgi:hypothetical protein